ncbi:MAG: cobalt-precorrin-5B (C(1))-methyltransferase CbiD [Thermodesulfobacteriota bacterium]
MARRLRSGYTTGACAAAAARAAVELLVTGIKPESVAIPFPDGSRHLFAVQRCVAENGGALAAVIKDAGDDPDVTNGAEIVAFVRFLAEPPAAETCVSLESGRILLCAGEGVGRATRPGLAVGVGEPAINPVPRRMIAAAVLEGLGQTAATVEIVISVPRGRELAEKTLNRRLGIVGGLSILGTTGIVRPVSAEAWTATIRASLDVARAAGLAEVVLATGRTSEKGAQELLGLPEEAHAMMGDYLQFSLREAALRGFVRIHLAGMWAKIMKAALEIPQTHVRHGALEVADGAALLGRLGAEEQLLTRLVTANTAREMYELLAGAGRRDLIRAVCLTARRYGEKVSGRVVRVILVDGRGKVVEHV